MCSTINDLLESCGLAMGLNLSLKEVNQFFFYPFLFPFINWREGGGGGVALGSWDWHASKNIDEAQLL